jgi:hypothetical protein
MIPIPQTRQTTIQPHAKQTQDAKRTPVLDPSQMSTHIAIYLTVTSSSLPICYKYYFNSSNRSISNKSERQWRNSTTTSWPVRISQGSVTPTNKFCAHKNDFHFRTNLNQIRDQELITKIQELTFPLPVDALFRPPTPRTIGPTLENSNTISPVTVQDPENETNDDNVDDEKHRHKTTKIDTRQILQNANTTDTTPQHPNSINTKPINANKMYTPGDYRPRITGGPGYSAPDPPTPALLYNTDISHSHSQTRHNLQWNTPTLKANHITYQNAIDISNINDSEEPYNIPPTQPQLQNSTPHKRTNVRFNLPTQPNAENPIQHLLDIQQHQVNTNNHTSHTNINTSNQNDRQTFQDM